MLEARGGDRPKRRKPSCVDADLVVREPLDLAPWGVAGRVVPMPGHTPGSLVVVLDDGRAFVGD
jgi:glyoxylase-like metal-dependent hydrolase (beta-lactamase superfamily II)